MSPQCRISLCMIVKNEARYLPGCLESIRQCVDEIIFVDTGSTDDTVQIAERFGAKIYSFEWINDFSAARNESLRHATGDWILYLDADERLLSNGNPECLRQAACAPHIDAYSVLIASTRTAGDQLHHDITYNIRFFRNYPGIHFVNEVHERVEPFLMSKGARLGTAPFTLEHLGYDLGADAMRQKHQRNLELSRKHLQHSPDDAYALYYLGMTLLQMGKSAESDAAFRDALRGKGLTQGFRAVVLNILAYGCFSRSEYPEALEKAKESLKAVPSQDTARLLAGMAHFQMRDYSAALAHLLPSYQFLRLPPERRRTQLSQEHSFLEEADLLKAIAVSYAHTGNSAQAIPFFRRYLEAQPDREHEMLRLLGMCCLNAQDYLGANRYLGEAVVRGADPSRLSLPQAYACFQLGEMDRAVECLLRAGLSHDGDRANAMKLLSSMAQNNTCATALHAGWDQLVPLLSLADLSQLQQFTETLMRFGNMALLYKLLHWAMPRNGTAEPLLREVVDAADQMEIAGAVEPLFDALARSFTNSPVLVELLMALQIKSGRLERAVETCSRLCCMVPHDPRTLRLLVGLYAKMGDFDKARMTMNQLSRG